MKNSFFITGTDTNVGKTVVTLALGSLLQDFGINVGVMKPVQCAGEDAAFLKERLAVTDPLETMNPYYAPEPLSPHVAFARAGLVVDPAHILKIYEQLQARHEIMLVEGAGGLMVPLGNGYLVADLARDMGLPMIIVARPGLGTINHTLLTVAQARHYGIAVAGVIFSDKDDTRGIAAATNPDAVARFGNVPVLGTVPRLSDFDRAAVVQQCRGKVDLEPFLASPVYRTRELQQKDRDYIWHPFTQMKDWLADDPLVIDRGQGSYLIDTDGNRYLDGVASLWVNVHGHGKKEIDDILRTQVGRLSHSTLLGLANTPSVELAEKLVAITPPGLAKVFYSDNGSTSVEIAVKMAYQYWQNTGRPVKTDIVHLANAYHGDTLGSVSIGGINLFHQVYRGLVFKTIQLDFPDCYRAPEGKTYPDYAFECLEKFEQLLTERHQTIAAFVAEPVVQGAAGMIMWPEGILRKMRALCRQYDVIFIADEVATGFGRTGTMFACEQEGVTPDILCLAKGLTGGYLPLAATLTTQKIFDGFVADYEAQKTFFHGHTYTGNPLGCAAALANLEIFEKEKTLVTLQPKIKFLSERLETFRALPYVGDVRQRGFMAGIELVRDKATKEPFAWEERVGVKVCRKVRERGVILRPLGNVIVLMPPLSMTREELTRVLDAAYWAIGAVAADRTLSVTG